MKVCILGSGAYGIALSSILVSNKKEVIMWTINEEEAKFLNEKRESEKLKGYKIDKNIEITTDMEKAVLGSDLIVISVPAFAFESTVIKLKKYINKYQRVLIATKGIQQDTCLFLSDVFHKYLKNSIAVISGPTFAVDIVKGVPIGFSMATKSKKTEMLIRECFENNTTKFRRTRDIIGIEICGSIKNVMAIASGMLDGMGVTDSTRALFLTESMNDIKELIDALGGRKKSILSFAGFGDILMTCTSKNSRNFSFGYLIGKGATQKEVDDYLKNTTVEGMYTLKSIHKLVRKKKVKMPIINLINDIINGKKPKEEMLRFLIEKE
jgi:glycerol-3-phosphate dehydrogenase (NAD(P)+)